MSILYAWLIPGLMHDVVINADKKHFYFRISVVHAVVSVTVMVALAIMAMLKNF